MSCVYNGQQYSDGAEICRFGTLFRCRNSGWVSVGSCATDGEEPFLPVMRLIDDFLKVSDPEKQAFKADPTGYLKKKMAVAGLSPPDTFHAHYVDSDGEELVPPEDDDTPEGREVYEISNGEIALKNEAGLRGDCNGCQGICIVIRF